MMYFRNIPCRSIIRTNHLSEPPLVLISSDNRRSTVVASSQNVSPDVRVVDNRTKLE